MGRLLDPCMIMDMDMDQQSLEDEFFSNASMDDGVSGQKPIDTTYENTSESYVHDPRSKGE